MTNVCVAEDKFATNLTLRTRPVSAQISLEQRTNSALHHSLTYARALSERFGGDFRHLIFNARHQTALRHHQSNLPTTGSTCTETLFRVASACYLLLKLLVLHACSALCTAYNHGCARR